MIRSSAASDATPRMRKRSRDVTRPVMVGSFDMENHSTFTVTSVGLGRPGGGLAVRRSGFWWIQRRQVSCTPGRFSDTTAFSAPAPVSARTESSS